MNCVECRHAYVAADSFGLNNIDCRRRDSACVRVFAIAHCCGPRQGHCRVERNVGASFMRRLECGGQDCSSDTVNNCRLSRVL